MRIRRNVIGALLVAGALFAPSAALAEWKAAGMQRILLQMLDQEDIAALELFARTVLPAL